LKKKLTKIRCAGRISRGARQDSGEAPAPQNFFGVQGLPRYPAAASAILPAKRIFVKFFSFVVNFFVATYTNFLAVRR
jgi:hypothetical protein